MKKQENGRQSVKESSVKNGKKRVRRNADRYEWFSDENDYFRCCEMTNVYAEPHFHGSWEFIFVAEGRLCALLDGEEYRAEAGDVLFIPGFVVHYIPGEEKNRSFSIVFSDSYKKTFDEEYGKQFDFVLKNQGERSAEIFRLVEACQSRFPSFNACEKHGFADLMLGMLANLYPMKSCEEKPSGRIIVNVLRYLNENYAKNVTVESVAHTFGYSKNYLSALFNRYTGMNFCDYLSRLRVSEALRRLGDEKTERNVTETAMDCGFNSMNTFYRAKQRFVARERARRDDIT